MSNALDLENRTHQELSVLLGTTLADAELRFQAVVESLSEGLAIFDATGVLVYCNSAFEQLTGYSRDEMYGKRVYEIFFPPGSPELDNYFENMLERYRARRRGVVETYRSFIFRKNGERRWIETKAGPFRDVNGNIVGSIGANTDITERALLEEQLQLAHRHEAAQNIAASVAGNFGDLITVLGGQAEALLDDSNLSEESRKRLSVIRQCTDVARRLTHHLLLTTRPPIASIEPVDLNELIRHSFDLIRGIISDSFRLEIELNQDPPPVQADPAHLQQAVISLILYIRRLFGSGGSVRITTNEKRLATDIVTDFGSIRAGRYSTLVIEHSGQRTTATRIYPLFRPLGAASAPPDERMLKSEIELWSSYTLVRQFNGEMTVNAGADGKATLSLYFPISDTDRAMKKPGASEAPNISGNETVAVIEESPSVREFLVELLGKKGYKVLQAVDLEDVKKLLSVGSGQPQLVIASQGFSANGAEIVRKIAADYPGTRVLLLSGSSYDTNIIEQQESLGAAILLKPFTSADLLQAVRRLLDKKLTVRLRPSA
jgi:PAS domain S-box-containing protein